MVVDKKWKGIFPLEVFSAASGFFDLPDWLVYKATGSATRCHRDLVEYCEHGDDHGAQDNDDGAKEN